MAEQQCGPCHCNGGNRLADQTVVQEIAANEHDCPRASFSTSITNGCSRVSRTESTSFCVERRLPDLLYSHPETPGMHNSRMGNFSLFGIHYGGCFPAAGECVFEAGLNFRALFLTLTENPRGQIGQSLQRQVSLSPARAGAYYSPMHREGASDSGQRPLGFILLEFAV